MIVVGAGAAGILASWRAGRLGAKVLLLEKGPRIGTKILVSGGGKCNITHDGPISEVLRAFRANEAQFLRPAMYQFTNQQVLELFTAKGLNVYTRPDGRVFPVDKNAKDVVAILGKHLAEAHVDVRLNSAVKRIRETHSGFEVETATQSFRAGKLILSVGGSSYPGTGTTGDGYPWVKQLGHSLVPIRAALAPIYLQTDSAWAEWSGIALRDVILKAKQGREIARWRGDLLFTHHGLSGPCALGVTREIAERREHATRVEVDLLPDVPHESLRANIGEWIKANPKKLFSTFLEEVVPSRLVDPLARAVGANPSVVLAGLGGKSQNRLVEVLKAWPLGLVRTIPLEKGEVVAGGVPLDEVDQRTMRSLRCENLFLCGELLDIAGPVGGYNLQAAFSTGYVAGDAAARKILDNA